MTKCELNIKDNRNCIRTQISWNTQTSQIPVSNRISNRNYSVEKNIRPVKRDSKPFSQKKFQRPQRSSKVCKGYIKLNIHNRKMKISVDNYEKDIIMETLQYRLENDRILLIDGTLKDDLEDLLCRLEEEYV